MIVNWVAFNDQKGVNCNSLVGNSNQMTTEWIWMPIEWHLWIEHIQQLLSKFNRVLFFEAINIETVVSSNEKQQSTKDGMEK